MNLALFNGPDIGAKSSNVLFFEDGKIFSRSINIGPMPLPRSLPLNKRCDSRGRAVQAGTGLCGAWGAYQDPDNPQQAAISKIARQVMTRLHIQVNQTIQSYKTQRKGGAPERMFLAGGASVLPYTAQFSEKLNVEVDYFNPSNQSSIDPSLDLEELGRIAPAFGTVVGMGLRSVFQCPVELNLMPKSLLDKQEFERKKPFLAAAVVVLVLLMFLVGFFFQQVASTKRRASLRAQRPGGPADSASEFSPTRGIDSATRIDHATRFGEMIQDRFLWKDVLAIIRQSLIETERDAQRQYAVDSGLWIESLRPDSPGVNLTGAAVMDTWEDEEEEPSMMMDIEMMKDMASFRMVRAMGMIGMMRRKKLRSMMMRRLWPNHFGL